MTNPTTETLPDGAIRVCVGTRRGTVSSWHLVPGKVAQLRRCSRCPQPHDNWPAADSGLLCQDCWEAESDAAWWATMRALDGADLLRPVPNALQEQQQEPRA